MRPSQPSSILLSTSSHIPFITPGSQARQRISQWQNGRMILTPGSVQRQIRSPHIASDPRAPRFDALPSKRAPAADMAHLPRGIDDQTSPSSPPAIPFATACATKSAPPSGRGSAPAWESCSSHFESMKADAGDAGILEQNVERPARFHFAAHSGDLVHVQREGIHLESSFPRVFVSRGLHFAFALRARGMTTAPASAKTHAAARADAASCTMTSAFPPSSRSDESSNDMIFVVVSIRLAWRTGAPEHDVADVQASSHAP